MLENISSKELFIKIYKWRKTFIKITLFSTLLIGIIVFLMPKHYKSTTILFAARQFSVSKLVIEANAGNQEDYMQIGDEDDCEKLIQLLTSDALKIKVADAFNLWERWDIKDTNFSYHYLKLKWDDQVSIKRTEFNSIKVEVYDYTANGSAQIANGISDYCQVLRNLGVLHYKEQVKAYSKSYAKAIEKNDVEAMKRLNITLDILKKYGGAYENIHDNLEKYGAKYPDIKMKYDEALVNYNKIIPAKFVVEKARPNEFKAKPKRLIIIAISVIACNLIGLFVLLLKDSITKIKIK